MNSVVSDPALIGLDWGTSSLRAFLLSGDGEVLESRYEPSGIMSVKNGAFETAFERLVSDWLDGHDVPVVASGMITSRNGWLETPYQSAPAGPVEFAKALVPLTTTSGVTINFITGLSTENDGAPDVMRGEETQIVGVSAQGDGVFVMPGTHSKWVTVQDGRIENFSTFMTGDVFAALKNHTILGTFVEDGPESDEGFRLGVSAGLDGSVKLLERLFHVRTLALFEKISKEQTGDYLSGLLIGSEIAAALAGIPKTKKVTIVANDELTRRYEVALEIAGIATERASADAAAMGQFAIAKSAGVLS